MLLFTQVTDVTSVTDITDVTLILLIGPHWTEDTLITPAKPFLSHFSISRRFLNKALYIMAVV